MNTVEEKKKKERSANFSPNEVELLVNLVIEHANTIECKKTNAATWKEKENEWEKLKITFNSRNSSCPRTVKTLKTKYEGIKKDLRKKRAIQKQEIYKTGGGSCKTIVFTPTEELLLSLIFLTSEGLPGRHGDDHLESNTTSNATKVLPTSEQTTDNNYQQVIATQAEVFYVDLNEVTNNNEPIIIDLPAETATSDSNQVQPSILAANKHIIMQENMETTSEATTSNNWSHWNPKQLRQPVSMQLRTPRKRKIVETKNEAIQKIAQISSKKDELLNLQIKATEHGIAHKQQLQNHILTKAEAELKLIQLKVENKKLDKRIKLATLKGILLSNKLKTAKLRRSRQ